MRRLLTHTLLLVAGLACLGVLAPLARATDGPTSEEPVQLGPSPIGPPVAIGVK